MNFENLPKKDHYRFKEITSLTGVKPYVLRFWESEFPQISPATTSGGDKVYSQNDLQCVEKIRDLLFDDKLSIPQAKMYLDRELREEVLTSNGQAMNSSLKAEVELIPDIPTHQEPTQEEFNNEPPKVMYRGVETRASIGSLFANAPSSVKELQESLRVDLDAHKEVLFNKQFNDQDVLRLVQAKKKLGSLLTKIDTIIEAKRWS